MAAVAQLVEPRIVIPVVVGSSPISRPTSPPLVNPYIFLNIFYFEFQDFSLTPVFNSKSRQLSVLSRTVLFDRNTFPLQIGVECKTRQASVTPTM